MHFKQQTVFM
jgi:hypothetical protein